MEDEIMIQDPRHVAEPKPNRCFWSAGHENPQLDRSECLCFGKELEDLLHILIVVALVQCIKHEYQRWSIQICLQLRERLNDKLSPLLAKISLCDIWVLLYSFADIA